MSSRLTRLGFAALGIMAVIAPTTAAFAKTNIPYTDTRSNGSIALCNAAGQNITHGSVYDKPFVYRAVSSVPAPAQYQGTGRVATLFAFQARKNVDPSAWDGKGMTAGSKYTNPLVPMAQGSKRDYALSDYLDEYPLAWDGYVQLRIFVGAPNAGVDNDSYPSATIEVSGATWTLLDPVTLSCTNGSATTPEDLIPSSNPVGLGSPQPLYNFTPGVVATATPPASAIVTAGHSSGGSGGTPVGILAGSAAGVVVLGGGTLWWRRRSSRGT